MSIVKWVAVVVTGVAIVLILILGTMRLGLWNPGYQTVMERHAGPPSKFVMVGNVKLHVRDEGSGPVILMLHSSMSNLRIWDGWADELKKRYRVIRIDWPPYGLSVDPVPSQGMQGIVTLLEKFVDQEKLGRFTLVGSSSGATISVLYTAKHPDRVDALALSTLPLAAPPTTPAPWTISALSWVHDHLVPNYQPRLFYQLSLSYLYGVPSRLKPQTVQWYYETNNIPGGFARVRAYYEANKKAVWSKGASKEAAMIRVPILLQWGDRDVVLPTPLADSAKAQFANAPVTLIHYPDVGHYPMLELPVETGRDLMTFLSRVHSGRVAQPDGASETGR